MKSRQEVRKAVTRFRNFCLKNISDIEIGVGSGRKSVVRGSYRIHSTTPEFHIGQRTIYTHRDWIYTEKVTLKNVLNVRNFI